MNVPYPTSRAEAEKLITSLQKDFGIGPVVVSPHHVRAVVRNTTVGENSLVDPESAEMEFLRQAQDDLVRITVESDETVTHAVHYGTESVTESLEESVGYLRTRFYQRDWKVRLFAPIGAGVHIDPEDPRNQDLVAVASGFRNAFEANTWALGVLGDRLENIRLSGPIELDDRTEDGKSLPMMRYSLIHTSSRWTPEMVGLEMNS